MPASPQVQAGGVSSLSDDDDDDDEDEDQAAGSASLLVPLPLSAGQRCWWHSELPCSLRSPAVTEFQMMERMPPSTTLCISEDLSRKLTLSGSLWDNPVPQGVCLLSSRLVGSYRCS